MTTSQAPSNPSCGSIRPAEIIRSRRRTLSLVITEDARLQVRAPVRATQEYIDDFIAKKSSWIDRKLSEVALRPKPPKLEFTDGEKLPYLGKYYPIFLKDSDDKSVGFDDGFTLARPERCRARELFVRWYREKAVSVIKGRLEVLAAGYGLRYGKFRVTGARRKWGSCGPGGDLIFSWRLVMAPISVIDYVVTHELAHIIRRDHSPLFWKKVEEMCPSFRDSACWLKDNGQILAGII